MFVGRLRALRLLLTTLNFSIFKLYGFYFPTYYPYIYTYIELRISRYKGGDNTRLYLAGLYLAFSALPTLPIAAGLALAVLAEIASFMPIPPNINIVVRFLLLQMVTSKNKINRGVNLLATGAPSKWGAETVLRYPPFNSINTAARILFNSQSIGVAWCTSAAKLVCRASRKECSGRRGNKDLTHLKFEAVLNAPSQKSWYLCQIVMFQSLPLLLVWLQIWAIGSTPLSKSFLPPVQVNVHAPFKPIALPRQFNIFGKR